MLKRSADRSETEGEQTAKGVGALAALTALAALRTLGCGGSFGGGVFAGVKGDGEGDRLTGTVNGEVHGIAWGVLVLGGGEFGVGGDRGVIHLGDDVALFQARLGGVGVLLHAVDVNALRPAEDLDVLIGDVGHHDAHIGTDDVAVLQNIGDDIFDD